jgi:hypothetical protein
MSYKKNWHGDRVPPSVQDIDKQKGELYWKELQSFKARLKNKYDGYISSPTTHRDYIYYSKRFLDNYKNSGMRWKDYWQEKLEENFDKDLKDARSRIWEEIENKFKSGSEQDRRGQKKTETGYRRDAFEGSRRSWSDPAVKDLSKDRKTTTKEDATRNEKTEKTVQNK